MTTREYIDEWTKSASEVGGFTMLFLGQELKRQVGAAEAAQADIIRLEDEVELAKVQLATYEGRAGSLRAALRELDK